MLVLGINLGSTLWGKPLRDGGTCFVNSEEILIAIAEERITRRKGEGGFERSFEYCQRSLGLNASDIDIIIYSSCCEPPRENFAIPISNINPRRIAPIPSHHLSHAFSTFLVSPFEQAIIIVLDSGGNVLGQHTGTDMNWWKFNREQHSYYIGKDTKITLHSRDFFDPYEAGIGELYRAFTKFLGWESYIYSGKTMGLSAFGSNSRFKGTGLFYFEGSRLKSKIRNDPMNPIQMLQSFSIENGINFGPPRSPQDSIEQIHMDTAHYIQEQSEKAIIGKIRKLYKETKLKNLCMAGGVGLNCLINTKILEETPIERVFVQPAAGDQGQCLGNALYGLFEVLGLKHRFEMNSAFLGPAYVLTAGDVLREIQKYDGRFAILNTDSLIHIASELIAEGKIIGWFQGRSEFGPRALGNRSILADPRNKDIKERLNSKVKRREFFMPFAPAILEEHLQDFFEIDSSSPFMLFAPKVKPGKKGEIPAVVHIDGTSRLQTVARASNLYGVSSPQLAAKSILDE